MKKSELRKIIKEEIQKLKEKIDENSLEKIDDDKLQKNTARALNNVIDKKVDKEGGIIIKPGLELGTSKYKFKFIQYLKSIGSEGSSGLWLVNNKYYIAKYDYRAFKYYQLYKK